MSEPQRTTEFESTGTSAPVTAFTAPSGNSDLHYVGLTNNARPTLHAIKRTSRHLGSQSPEPVDDITEHLGSPARYLHRVGGLDLLQRTELIRTTHSTVQHHNRPTGGPIVKPDPNRTFRTISMEEDAARDREGMVFDYFHMDKGGGKGYEDGPIEASSNTHIASQNSQAYDDTVDCASASDGSSPRDIEMQTFAQFERDDANDAMRNQNSQIYDEAYEAVNSDNELLSVKVEKPPGDNSSRRGMRQTNVDAGVNFGLGWQKDYTVGGGVGGRPPFGDPLDQSRLNPSVERLLGSRKSLSVERDFVATGMPPAEAIDGLQQGKKNKEKRGEKGRNLDSGYDINGNPALASGNPVGLLSSDIPHHLEKSSFASAANLHSFRQYRSANKSSALDDTLDRGMSWAERSKKEKRRKKQRKKEDSTISSEKIPGHRHYDDIDEQLKFLNDGKVESKKDEEMKQKKENGKMKNKKKGKKGKVDGETEVQTNVGESVASAVSSGEESMVVPVVDHEEIDNSGETGRKAYERKISSPTENINEAENGVPGKGVVHISQLKMVVCEPKVNLTKVKVAPPAVVPVVSKPVIHQSESPETGKQLLEAIVKSSKQSAVKDPVDTKAEAEREEKTTPLQSPALEEKEDSLLLDSRENDIMFTDFLVPSPPKEEDFTVVTKSKKKKPHVQESMQRYTPNNYKRGAISKQNGPHYARPAYSAQHNHSVVDTSGRISSPPPSLNSGGFPVLGREGRRNSTGTVPTASQTCMLDESDSESVKSLPFTLVPSVASGNNNTGFPSYANIVSHPRGERTNDGGIVEPVNVMVKGNDALLTASETKSTAPSGKYSPDCRNEHVIGQSKTSHMNVGMKNVAQDEKSVVSDTEQKNKTAETVYSKEHHKPVRHVQREVVSTESDVSVVNRRRDTAHTSSNEVGPSSLHTLQSSAAVTEQDLSEYPPLVSTRDVSSHHGNDISAIQFGGEQNPATISHGRNNAAASNKASGKESSTDKAFTGTPQYKEKTVTRNKGTLVSEITGDVDNSVSSAQMGMSHTKVSHPSSAVVSHGNIASHDWASSISGAAELSDSVAAFPKSTQSSDPQTVGAVPTTKDATVNLKKSVVPMKPVTTRPVSAKRSGKGTAISSVIFLDQKFQEPAAPLDISFGFEAEDSDLGGAQPQQVAVASETKKDEAMLAIKCDNGTHTWKSLNVTAADAVSRVSSQDVRDISGARVLSSEKTSVVTAPNGLILPRDCKRNNTLVANPGCDSVVHRLAKEKPREKDANYDAGRFDQEGAVKYALMAWLDVVSNKKHVADSCRIMNS